MNIVITGVSGFIGSALGKALQKDCNFDEIIGLTRKAKKELDIPIRAAGCLYEGGDAPQCFQGMDVVIHLAGLAHVNSRYSDDPLAEFRRVNVSGSLNVAKAALAAGVKRMVFVSSVGVNGDTNETPFTEEDLPRPVNAYAQSKWEAERELLEFSQKTGMEVVIIRPPLVYGPNAPGKFGSLVKWIDRGIPLPLGAVDNRRTLVSLDNLLDLITVCIDHPAATGQVFLAGDGEDLSTTQLLRGAGEAMGKHVRLIPVPVGMLKFGAWLLGKQNFSQGLLGSLQVDISKARNLLGWEPPLSVEEGLRRCFVSENGR
ncbi:SDR family oxidoreductase [Marinobacter panjinensis]|uniref:SDR family oxidoreductase n=1 Tax=Marinobacter panjinensis TaxID=2576384 RepID=A0A4U6R2D2_9GAMM|nr:SDR family oxidoreductase [Marinobacter panjinensis]MCR8913721.1 SDR family oxidoreductase [Marinobacter panjinensis]TKV67629.1 SDR family oxidoreductase [Marinobacter panjinensis]